MELTENARIVLERRYLLKDEYCKFVETPEGLFGRVAKMIASAESIYGGNAEEWGEKFMT